MKKRSLYIWTAIVIAIPIAFLYPLTFITPNPASTLRYVGAILGLFLALGATQYLRIEERERKLLDGLAWALIVMFAAMCIDIFVIWYSHDWKFTVVVLDPLLIFLGGYYLAGRFGFKPDFSFGPLHAAMALIIGAVFGWLLYAGKAPVFNLQSSAIGLILAYAILGAIASEFIFRFFLLRLMEPVMSGVRVYVYQALVYAALNFIYLNKIFSHYQSATPHIAIVSTILYFFFLCLFGAVATAFARDRASFKGHLVYAICFNAAATSFIMILTLVPNALTF